MTCQYNEHDATQLNNTGELKAHGMIAKLGLGLEREITLDHRKHARRISFSPMQGGHKQGY
ncbi:MAG: hypothetical protein ACRD8W_03605 [Nitrososphaeraceae archaeon]